MRNYPKPWLAGEPPKPRGLVEEVKGQISDSYLFGFDLFKQTRIIGREHSWNIVIRMEMDLIQI